MFVLSEVCDKLPIKLAKINSVCIVTLHMVPFKVSNVSPDKIPITNLCHASQSVNVNQVNASQPGHQVMSLVMYLYN